MHPKMLCTYHSSEDLSPVIISGNGSSQHQPNAAASGVETWTGCTNLFRQFISHSIAMIGCT